MSNAISVDRISKSYGDFVAVNELSIEVKTGSIFGLLGPNGAGKSTTIRMIVNITMPDSGQITLFGRPISAKLQERVGYLPEDRGLYKKMKVGEQLAFFAELKGLPRQEAHRRIDAWLKRIEMTEWKNKKWEELSKGMQQKVQFVSTILHSPDLVILDEPFSGLDPISASLLKEISPNRDHTEIILQDGADPQSLLRQLVGAGARLTRFEMVAPSLNEIFIESVKMANEQ